MKKNWIPAGLILALALVAAAGSRGFIGPCVHEDGSLGACHWTGRMLMGVGGLMGVLSLMALSLSRHRAGLYLSMLPTALLGALAPNGLMALCASDSMRCRMLMRPAMTLLFAFMLIAALAGALMSMRRDGRR